MAPHEYNGQAAEEAQHWRLVDELLDLRRETAAVLGREQYLYRVVDEAVESGSVVLMQRARAEFELATCEAL